MTDEGMEIDMEIISISSEENEDKINTMHMPNRKKKKEIIQKMETDTTSLGDLLDLVSEGSTEIKIVIPIPEDSEEEIYSNWHSKEWRRISLE